MANKRRPRHHHISTNDEWDVVMDAIYEGNTKLAAQIVIKLRAEHGMLDATPKMLAALNQAPESVRREFYDLIDADHPANKPLKWRKIGAGVYHAESPWGLYTIDGNNVGRNRWNITYPGDFSADGMVDSLAEAKAWAELDASARRRSIRKDAH